MENMPIHVRLRGQPCMVLGGGVVAQRKCEWLLQAGAHVRVVALEVRPELAEQVVAAGGVVCRKSYDPSDLEGQRLVIAATNDRVLNRRVFNDAEARAVWVNVVDDPALCRFVFPAIVDRSPLVIGVSTSGLHPVLSRHVRTMLETTFPSNYGNYAQLLARYRAATKHRFADVDERRRFWESVLESPVTEQALTGNLSQAEDLLQAALEAHFSGTHFSGTSRTLGEVYVVGAGPGDPDLLTLRALRLLQRADVVIYDRLVGNGIVELARRDAEKIYAGKTRGDHAISQSDINALLVDLATAGKRVCRLKGGDPFIFGRGGEEIDSLMAKGIPFQVVPGVTAASGCAAYAGIPLTHRDVAQSVRFITGHMKDGYLDLPWADLANPRETLVFYMGLVSLPIICQQLVAHGLPSSYPVALVQQGTLPNQRVYCGELATFADHIAACDVTPPALLIVGRVVSLRSKLSWFDGISSTSKHNEKPCGAKEGRNDESV
ncbi:MAG: siroheme synthase CysG [Gammaproteobacteria bacterium]